MVRVVNKQLVFIRKHPVAADHRREISIRDLVKAGAFLSNRQPRKWNQTSELVGRGPALVEGRCLRDHALAALRNRFGLSTPTLYQEVFEKILAFAAVQRTTATHAY